MIENVKFTVSMESGNDALVENPMGEICRALRLIIEDVECAAVDGDGLRGLIGA